MSRTDAIAQAIARELAKHGADIERWSSLRSLSIQVNLKPLTTTVRSVIVRPEFETITVETDERGHAVRLTLRRPDR